MTVPAAGTLALRTDSKISISATIPTIAIPGIDFVYCTITQTLYVWAGGWIVVGTLNYIQFQTACTVGDTFDPVVALRAGCPYIPHWDFGNGDSFDGLSVNYAGFADAGPHTS